MTPLDDVRFDARRACAARRERSSSNPAPLVLPTAAAVVTVTATVFAATVLGLSAPQVLSAAVAVAVAGALVAHRTVANLLAGMALLLIRPYGADERVRLRPGADGEPIEGVVLRVGAANSTLATDDGLLVVPNRRLLAVLPERPRDSCSG